MRRRHQDLNDIHDTQVFSSDAWGTTNSSYVPPEAENLSQYAATSIPEGNSHSVRTARYAVSPHSQYYEQPAHALTNSTDDPFGHTAYEGSLQQHGVPQNLLYDDMPSPVRKSPLGQMHLKQEPAKHEITETENHDADPPAPLTPNARYSPHGLRSTPQPSTPTVANPAPQVPQAPQQQRSPIITSDQQSTPKTTNLLEKNQSTTSYEPVVDLSSGVIDLTEPAIGPPLSDFEQEFLETQATVETEPPVEQEVIQEHPAIQDHPVLAAQAPTSINLASPILFTSNPSQLGSAAYDANSDFFSIQYNEESDEDQFYKEAPTRAPIQLDLEFVKKGFKKLSGHKIIVAIIIVLLAASAFFIMRPMPGSKSQQPVQEIIDNPVGTTVTPYDSDTKVPVVNPNPDLGPTLEYDENGNAVYSTGNN